MKLVIIIRTGMEPDEYIEYDLMAGPIDIEISVRQRLWEKIIRRTKLT